MKKYFFILFFCSAFLCFASGKRNVITVNLNSNNLSAFTYTTNSSQENKRQTHKTTAAIAFVLSALIIIWVSLKLFVYKKPMIVPLGTIILLPFIPQMANLLNSGLNPIALFVIVIITIAIILFVLPSKASTVLGVSDDSFKDSLRFSLNKNEIAFKEESANFILTENNADLRVKTLNFFGSADLRLQNSKNSVLWAKIKEGVREYYNSNDIPVNNNTISYCMIFGFSLLAIAYMFAFVIS